MDGKLLRPVQRSSERDVDVDEEPPPNQLSSRGPAQHVPLHLVVKLVAGGLLLHILFRSKRATRDAKGSASSSRAVPRDGKVDLLKTMLLELKDVCRVFESSTFERLNDRLLSRWLRARKGDVQAAFAALCSHARWRAAEMPNGRVFEVRRISGHHPGRNGVRSLDEVVHPVHGLQEEIANELAAEKVFLQGYDVLVCPDCHRCPKEPPSCSCAVSCDACLHSASPFCNLCTFPAWLHNVHCSSCNVYEPSTL
jgi:hypothetical protein